MDCEGSTGTNLGAADSQSIPRDGKDVDVDAWRVLWAAAGFIASAQTIITCDERIPERVHTRGNAERCSVLPWPGLMQITFLELPN